MIPFSTRFFCWLGLVFGAAGGGYFLTLVLGLSFAVAALFAVITAAGFGWWLLRNAVEFPGRTGVYVAALITGTALLLYRSLDFLEKHGGWDAWALWNYHARMLIDQQRWANLFQPLAYDHPDYPLCLPAGLAFLIRAFPNVEPDSPGILVSFAGMLAVVLLLFGELFRKQPWVGIAVFFLLTQDDVFLRIAVSQYADTLVAFYLLTSVIALGYTASDRRAAVIAGAALGLCMWTKNEGFILALLTAICYSPRLLKKRVGILFLAGLSVPLGWWLIFKIGYAPQNDLSGQSFTTLVESLTVSTRYAQIWNEVAIVVREQYAVIAWLVVLCAGILAVRKGAPARELVLVVTVFLVYCVIFLVSPYEPEWHVRTALPRLIHQLVPTLLYACGILLSKYQFLPAEKLSR